MTRAAGAQERTLAVALVLVGGAVALVASIPTWISASVRDEGLPEVASQFNGRSVAPLVAAAGLLALAGGVASLLAGAWARRAIGALLLLVGGTAVWSVLSVLRDPKDVVAEPLADAVGLTQIDVATAALSVWPVVAVLGCTLIALGGGWLLVRSGRWQGPGRRFDRAEAGSSAGPDAGVGGGNDLESGSDADRPTDGTSLWDALDRGEDPTR